MIPVIEQNPSFCLKEYKIEMPRKWSIKKYITSFLLFIWLLITKQGSSVYMYKEGKADWRLGLTLAHGFHILVYVDSVFWDYTMYHLPFCQWDGYWLRGEGRFFHYAFYNLIYKKIQEFIQVYLL